jgi:tripartite-type tricarboxylate transporter receptor subunit TctC
VLVENVPGAGGTTGSARVAKAEPDGHTLVFGNIGTHAANVGLFRRLPYDPVADFAPVAIVAYVPLVMSVKAAHPAKTFAEFQALARTKPGEFTYGSAGVGSASHLGCLLLDAALGPKARHVAYRGAGPALNDLVAGQIDFMCDQTVTMMPQITGGTIRPLATLSRTRLSALPEIPTVGEHGVAGVEVEVWNALFVPKGTPTPIVERLFAFVREAQSQTAVSKRFADLGAIVPDAEAAGPSALKALVASEVTRWAAALKAAGVAPQ